MLIVRAQRRQSGSKMLLSNLTLKLLWSQIWSEGAPSIQRASVSFLTAMKV